ncbi:hypothetical protein ACIBQ1_53835 [Nonomuraea sp. NPDC050153]|uniref:hypothetical protein n=1 Tax=Nonomuraea sp. NPDC050153 TaxID=3364359 RepID=UPI0037A402FB
MTLPPKKEKEEDKGHTKPMSLTRRYSTSDAGSRQRPSTVQTQLLIQPGSRDSQLFFGPGSKSSLIIDYRALLGLNTEDSQNYIEDTAERLAPDIDASEVMRLDQDALLRMAYGMSILDGNPVDGLDYHKGIKALLRWARRTKVLPGAIDLGFEREVGGASGLSKSLLLRDLPPLSDVTVTELGKIYNPTRVMEVPRPLDFGKLESGLFSAIRQFLDLQLARFEAGPGQKLDRESLDRLRELAGFLQEYMKFSCGPYILANPDGPYNTGYELSKRVESSESVQLTDELLLSYAMNVANFLGYAPEFGRRFIEAGFDGVRDANVLRGLMKELLADPRTSEKVTRLTQLSGLHFGGGAVRLNPLIPRDQDRIEARWNHLRTMIHEFLHALTHPGFAAKADQIGQGQIIREGFVDMFAAIIFRQLSGDIQADPELAKRFMGDLGAVRPATGDQGKTGYGDSGKKAESVLELVGLQRASAGLLLGDTESVGLGRPGTKPFPGTKPGKGGDE